MLARFLARRSYVPDWMSGLHLPRTRLAFSSGLLTLLLAHFHLSTLAMEGPEER